MVGAQSDIPNVGRFAMLTDPQGAAFNLFKPAQAGELFKIGGTPMGAMFNNSVAQAARFWLYYFNVGNIDDAAKRVGDRGGKIMFGPQQAPGGGWIVQAADPQGAAFALLGKRP